MSSEQPACIVRNLYITNGWPRRPIRICRNSAPPGDVVRTNSQLIARTGDSRQSNSDATMTSKIRLPTRWFVAAGSATDAVRRGRSLAVTIVPPATKGHDLRRLRERPPVATGRVAHGLDPLLDGRQVVDATPHDRGVAESD